MKNYLLVSVMLLTAACTSTSGVMEAEDGSYLISARAAPAAGGTAGANAVAYEEAQYFCATKGKRAVVVTANERDVYQGAVGGGGGYGGGGFAAAGSAMLRFKCVPK